MSDSATIPSAQPVTPRFKKALVIFLGIVLAIAGGWEGFRFAKLHLALRYARREFSNRQFMRAEFWTDRALGVDGKNIEATRLMAEINEAQDRPAALAWRTKVAQIDPRSTRDIMAWAKSALRFGQGEMTLTALNSLPGDFKNRSAEYYELMAGCALANHEASLAEAYFIKAAELDHANPVYGVNVAAFRLMNSPTREARVAAARELEGMLADSRVNLFAVRALLRDAIMNRDQAGAQRFAEKLHSLPDHNFSDDLSCLEAAPSGQAFHSALEQIERRAESQPTWVTEAGDWLNAHGMAGETLRWFAQLPEAIRSNIRVQMTEAESHSALRDWNGLQAFLAKCQWDDCEFLRRAMLIRCKRELSQPWEKEWKQLAAQVDSHPPDGLLLAQLVIGWNWRDEALGLLWGSATKPETDARALQYLWTIYSRTNETGELWRVAKAQLQIDPVNPSKKNNEAFLSLLLHGVSERSERLSREACTANPKIPEWAATYAYALHLAGKEAQAGKVMENLPPEALGRPGVALYYAIVLEANGEHARARESLAKLNTNGMLPEERKLAADLAQQLNIARQ